MRIASFRCFAVTLLSFLTARANGQIDSNAIARIFCGSISGGCSVDVKCVVDTGLIKPDQFEGFNLSVGYDNSVRLADTSQYPGPSFQIDTISGQIVNLTFRNAERYYTIDANDGCEGGLILAFAPIPFFYNNGTLNIIPGQYKCNVNTWGFCEYGVNETCSGSCGSNDSIMDSVYLEIIPASSAVTDFTDVGKYFRAVSNNQQEVFSFNSEPFARNIQVFNVIGKTIFAIPIASGQNLNQATLPPGYYFARLGDQVAKFIVPPR